MNALRRKSPVPFPAIFAVVVWCFPLPPVRAAPGDLDRTFRGTGWTSFPLPQSGLMNDMAIQPDGKIVLTGSTQPVSTGSINDTLTCRFLPDGTPDPSFNGSGFLISPCSPATDSGSAVLLQNDGSLFIGGSCPHGPDFAPFFMRLHPDGSTDTSFGAGSGRVVYQYPGLELRGVRALISQPDGKMLVTGIGSGLYRILPDGSIDPSFAAYNKFQPIAALQNDGKILTATYNGGFVFNRLLPDGTQDPWYTDGQTDAVVWSGPPFALVTRILALPDGRILAAGTAVTAPGEPHHFIIARLLPTGYLDRSFNGTGWNYAAFGPDESAMLTSILVQDDGRILLVGFAGDWSDTEGSNNFDIAIARFMPDGTPDLSFGTNGKVLTDLGGRWEFCVSAALLPGPSAKLLVAGRRYEAYVMGSTSEQFFARFRTRDLPELAIADPAGNSLTNSPAPAQNIGLVTAGAVNKAFTVRNTGTLPLTGLAATLTAESHPGEFLTTQPGVSTLGPGEQTIFVVSLLPSPNSTPGPRTATLRIASNDPDAAPFFIIPLTGGKATPLETWRITWFGSPDNSGSGADLNDFDHDGLPDLLEYATRSHPHQPSTSAGTLTKNGGALEFTYQRDKSALTDLIFQVETATMPAGPWDSSGITETLLTDDGTVQSVRALLPDNSAGGKQFARLRVTRRQE